MLRPTDFPPDPAVVKVVAAGQLYHAGSRRPEGCRCPSQLCHAGSRRLEGRRRPSQLSHARSTAPKVAAAPPLHSTLRRRILLGSLPISARVHRPLPDPARPPSLARCPYLPNFVRISAPLA